MSYFKIKQNSIAGWILCFGFLATSIFVLGTKTAEAAYFQISPSSGTSYKGENFEAHILVNSDIAINAVSGVLTFPTRYLRIAEINKKNSIINFWVEEPSFSNAGEVGHIRFEGIVLNPGFTGNGGRIATIVFKTNGEGGANVNFIQSAILANDGLGTNVVASNRGAKFILLSSETSQEAKEKELAPQPEIGINKNVPAENYSTILIFWETLPVWIKTNVLIFIGLATIILSFIILSFGIIVLIWLWSNIWHRRDQFFALLRLIIRKIKKSILEVLGFVTLTSKEVNVDTKYGLHQFASEFKKASQLSSFKNLAKDFFSVLFKIIKRFFTRNIKKNE